MIWVLILCVSMVALADALLTTVLGLRIPMSGLSAAWVGFIMSGYWLGYVLGGLTGNRLIVRVGRIRTFAGAAGMVTVCVLATTLTGEIALWVLSRAATGYCCAVMFLAVESWLNGAATAETRGGVFGGYMVGTYFAMAVGQLALDWLPATDERLLDLVAMFFAGSVMPLVWANLKPPALGPPSRFGPLKLLRIAPLAAVACLLSGVATGAFYAMAPLFFQARGQDSHALSWLIASAIFGGLLGQWPLGRLSDREDRRKVILYSGAGLLLTSPLVCLYPSWGSLVGWCLLTGFFGVFLAVIYPLAVALANDAVSHDDVVNASGALILVNGAGSAIGPLLAGLLMHFWGGPALFGVLAVASLGVMGGCVRAIRKSAHCAPVTRPFVPVNAQAAAGSLLHPRH